MDMDQNDVRKVLAENIKKRRKELGLTQTKLAELADISEPYMNDIERRQTWVSDKTLAKLAWALNLEVHELFVRSGERGEAQDDRKDAFRLFLRHKQEMHDYIEKSFDALMRDVIKV